MTPAGTTRLLLLVTAATALQLSELGQDDVADKLHSEALNLLLSTNCSAADAVDAYSLIRREIEQPTPTPAADEGENRA